MTNREILDDFKSKYRVAVSDYRPLGDDYVGGMQGITIWTDEGDLILYFPKQRPIAPTTECPDRWKLCEGAKDLPPSGTTCLATVECSGEKHVIITQFDHGTGWSNLEYGERVVSWMKLPEPLGGEQDGSD